MDKLDSMRAFRQVVESGGYAAAAREMGLTRSTVSKYVSSLEKELKTQLLVRSTRKVRPSEAGLAFYDRCLMLLSDYDDAVSTIALLQNEAQGKLRINAPMSFGTLYLSSVVADFMSLHPSISIELALADRLVDPIEEGFDVTIRIAEPQVSTSLISRVIAPAKITMCASPAYLKKFGTPSEPTELIKHRCLYYGYSTSNSYWQLSHAEGDVSVPVKCTMWSNNGEVLLDAAINDTGIAVLPAFIADNALTEGALVEVLPQFKPHQNTVISAIYPRHRHLSSKVQLFVQYAVERLGYLASTH